MKCFFYKFVVLVLFFILAAIILPQNGYCDCVIKGGVCGDPPTWKPCCEPDKYTCKKADEKDNYGTCEDKEEEGEKK